MRRLLSVDAWKPTGGITLDSPALEAVRAASNTAVIAGPGAGKTELLAQRACFLLQTGGCPSPRRILAISFKRDAAANLRDRVQKRCGKDLSSRFDSLTYDAFSKSLVDRFLPALPETWRPDVGYEIIADPLGSFNESIQNMTLPQRFKSVSFSTEDIRRITNEHGLYPLPLDAEKQTDSFGWVTAKLWEHFLRGLTPSRLTFPMITRLAELLLAQNGQVIRALRATYSHVFLDEFQDTTYWQYDLVRTAFLGSNAIITAVGDTKQRIMGWAGALPNAFEEFERDFGAHRHDLVINYRSAPRLVEIQQVLAERIDPKSVAVTSGRSEDDGVCEILVFADYRQEAATLAAQIALWVAEGVNPRDICVLAKQRVALYGSEVIAALQTHGLKARDEGVFQDLLAEPAVVTAIGLMELAVRERAPDAWNSVTQVLWDINGYSSETAYEKTSGLEDGLKKVLGELRKRLRNGRISSEGDLLDAVREAFDYIGSVPFKNLFPQYVQGDYFDKQLEKVASLLYETFEHVGNWPDALDAFTGVNTVPIMTVHKSKGLEYDTVVFIGLESSAFWSFSTQQDADTNAFFVALSRAKRRLYFTFSAVRNTGRGGRDERQNNTNIRPLYDILTEAGVPVRDLRSGS